MKNKYSVTVVRTGCVFVEAESEAEAMNIANRQTTDAVSWSDDWEATDAEKDDSYSGEYVCQDGSLKRYDVYKEHSIEMQLRPGLSARNYSIDDLKEYSESRSAKYGELIGQFDNIDAARALFEAEKAFCVTEETRGSASHIISFDELRLEEVEYDIDFNVEQSTLVEKYIDDSYLYGHAECDAAKEQTDD